MTVIFQYNVVNAVETSLGTLMTWWICDMRQNGSEISQLTNKQIVLIIVSQTLVIGSLATT
jgi:hypothetical protein